MFPVSYNPAEGFKIYELAHWGDTISTSGEYHDYIRGCAVHRGFQYKLEGFFVTLLPHMHHEISPMYS